MRHRVFTQRPSRKFTLKTILGKCFYFFHSVLHSFLFWYFSQIKTCTRVAPTRLIVLARVCAKQWATGDAKKHCFTCTCLNSFEISKTTTTLYSYTCFYYIVYKNSHCIPTICILFFVVIGVKPFFTICTLTSVCLENVNCFQVTYEYISLISTTVQLYKYTCI